MMSKILYSVEDGAAACDVGRTTFYALIRDGKIKTVKIVKRTLVHIDELQRFAASLVSTAA